MHKITETTSRTITKKKSRLEDVIRNKILISILSNMMAMPLRKRKPEFNSRSDYFHTPFDIDNNMLHENQLQDLILRKQLVYQTSDYSDQLQPFPHLLQNEILHNNYLKIKNSISQF